LLIEFCGALTLFAVAVLSLFFLYIEYIYFFALPVNVEGVGWLLGYKVDGGNALSLFFLLLVELLSRLCDVVAAAAPQICG